jgi:hypothetical protein
VRWFSDRQAAVRRLRAQLQVTEGVNAIMELIVTSFILATGLLLGHLGVLVRARVLRFVRGRFASR